MGGLVTFHSSVFVDAHDHAITAMYKRAYFVGLSFAVHESTVKTVKIGPLENFPLYGSYRKAIIIYTSNVAELHPKPRVSLYHC